MTCCGVSAPVCGTHPAAFQGKLESVKRRTTKLLVSFYSLDLLTLRDIQNNPSLNLKFDQIAVAPSLGRMQFSESLGIDTICARHLKLVAFAQCGQE